MLKTKKAIMEKTFKILTYLYGVLLLAGALLFFFVPEAGKWLFASGAVVCIVVSFAQAIVNRTSKLAQSRRQRLFFIASLFLGVAAWFMFIGSTNWVVFALVWVVVVIYLSFRS